MFRDETTPMGELADVGHRPTSRSIAEKCQGEEISEQDLFLDANARTEEEVADYDASSVIQLFLVKTSWRLGHSLALSWLRSTERIEPWFIHTGIDPPLHLARTIQALSRASKLDVSTAVWMEHLSEDVNALADGVELTQEECFSLAIKSLEHSALRLPVFSRRHARSMHLIAFLCRVSNDAGRHSIALRRMVQLAQVKGIEKKPGVHPEHYRLRMTYEMASMKRYGMGRQVYRASAVESQVALTGFELAENLAIKAMDRRSLVVEPVAHIAYGAIRGSLLSLLDLGRIGEALRKWHNLLKYFPDARTRYVPFDYEILACVLRSCRQGYSGHALKKEVLNCLQDFERGDLAEGAHFLHRDLIKQVIEEIKRPTPLFSSEHSSVSRLLRGEGLARKENVVHAPDTLWDLAS